jgi:hypothetical protein
MKRLLPIVVALAILGFGPAGAAAETVPRQAAGFVLGQDIGLYKDKLQSGTALPVRYLESIKEVEMKETRGFKSGIIGYGTCVGGNRILEIKLKYVDSSRDFYLSLLEKYKARFGEPEEWKGDAFGVVLSWKWNFADPSGNKISMILQHNVKDEAFKKGNVLKLVYSSLMEQEIACFFKKNPKGAEQPSAKTRPLKPEDWELLLPR